MSEKAPVSPIERLLEIMARLRDPVSGCPWDLKQSYASIVPHTLEEAYEVADAIEHGDMQDLREELGDLLFQVVFYSQLAKEDGHFDFAQVAAGIADKMYRRHPHVFGEAEFADDQALHRAWEQTKEQERAAKQRQVDTSPLAGVALGLPALLRAQKLQKRAAEVNFDWPDVRGCLAKVREEFDEVEQALAQGDRSHIEEELGDLLFAMVNLVRLQGMQAEQTLRLANQKFERRFRHMEVLLQQQGVQDLKQLSLEQWQNTWEAVKRKEFTDD